MLQIQGQRIYLSISFWVPGISYTCSTAVRHFPSFTLEDRLKLIDFGFSEIMASDDTVLQMPCGTLHYTSPEVLSRNYSNKCDLWSLGVKVRRKFVQLFESEQAKGDL